MSNQKRGFRRRYILCKLFIFILLATNFLRSSSTLVTTTEVFDQGNSKWRDLNHAMVKRNAFYLNQVGVARQSGKGDEHVILEAMEDYKLNVKKSGFRHMRTWNVFRRSLCWAIIPSMGKDSQHSKRSRTNEEGRGRPIYQIFRHSVS
ncbi:hypothetical protein HanRHA438_Chr07g0308921 [Helianthus annuus]|nr:hypothetical protein HanRHA438_Chr07g0308921 [Helianthus annuus]